MWRKVGNYTTYRGWLSDQSTSSVSFVSSALARPARGDEIEMLDAQRSRRQYRVTRVTQYDEHLSLIACRMAEATKRSAFPTSGRSS
jgi:hypothetical protein